MRTAITLTLFLALACGGHEQKTASTAAPATVNATSLSPEQLGELGAQLQKNPDRAQQLLTHHGLTSESFEKAIRDVTKDPEASKRYAAAYRRASS
jgi:hypothetical protein